MFNRFYIIGIKHCGKSSVGKKLSEQLNLPFYDLDELIEKSVNMSVREFYLKEGKEAFQKAELESIIWLEKNIDKYICATGGGICDNTKAYDILKNGQKTIYINTAFETVFNRIIKGGIPAFLKSDNPKNEFRELYNKRNKLYKEMAFIEANGDSVTPLEITDNIISMIEEQKNAR